ncbi:MAG: nucleotidyl transferase AbiEii/AbiGii toxin family protein [Spirochaetaceae bacterium]|nr:nucleotidyl transferase AbiEii/AbiGii toxin family protein [Spirochaetaceae bacterium]
MISPSEYYEKNLYPLQDGVLNTVSRCGTHFFLTGGTALSRAYYRHRYSDDLDFFVSSDNSFAEQVNLVLAALGKDGFLVDTGKRFIKDVTYWSAVVRRENSEAELKLDFVNDLTPRFGPLVKTALFDRTDSIQNILSNKITALFRYAAKDVADLREIFLHEKIDWPQAFREAREKEAGIEIPQVCEIISGMPEGEFDNIRWTNKPRWPDFCADIARMTEDMLGQSNP